jgi:amino acid adenylation domain-containing protein
MSPNLKLIPVDFDPFINGELLLAAPITESQLEIWLAAQMSNEANLASMLSQSLRLTGLLNIDLLHTAFKQLVSRHESLRITFSLDGKNILIAKQVEFNLPIIDLSKLSNLDREREIEKYQKQAISEPFDLKSGPLFSTKILKLDRQEHIIILTVHHIICDGWSYGLIVSDLAKIYTALNKGIPPKLEPPEYFSEYAFLEQKKIGSLAAIEIDRYWINKFATIPPVLELPLDYPRPPLRTFVTDCERYSLDSNLVSQIKQLGIRSGSSLMTTLLTAFEVFLFKITGNTELIVGVPTSGQTATGKYNLVGHCVNFLPLRSTIDPDRKFGEYLKSRTSEILDDYEHQDFTFGSLLQKLAIPREASRTPLISTVFNVDLDAKRDRSIFDELDLDTLTSRSYSGTFEFFFNATLTTDSGLNLDCQYNTSLFNSATIRRRLAEFENLLANIILDLNSPIHSLSLLSTADKHKLLLEWNNTHVDYEPDRCIHHLFAAQVERTPDAIAVIFKEQQLTYRELNDRSDRLSAYLRAQGVGSNVLVGLYAERSLNMVVGLWGILKAGGAYVPLDPAHPQERIEYIITDSQIKITVGDPQLLASLPKHQIAVSLETNWDQIEDISPSNLPKSHPEDLAYVIYTSGSTGNPKGVEVCHQSQVNLLNHLQHSPELTSADTLLAVTTICFDTSTVDMYLPLIVGAKIVLVDSKVAADGFQLLSTLRDSRATFMQATPASFRLLLAAGWEGSPQMRIVSTGEALPRNLANILLTKVAEVWDFYGPTETTVWATGSNINELRQVSDFQGAIELIGKPLANTQAYILDRYLQPVPIGIQGELHIGGDCLAKGYLNRPDLTAAKFIPNPFSDKPNARIYKTGDLARYLADGNIEYLDRIDNQVKIRGFRIELGEIEALLVKYPAVKQATVTARIDKHGDKFLAAYLVTEHLADNTSNTLSNRDLREFLQQRLPEYMIPSAFVMLDALPMTPNGKVDVRALPTPEYSRQESEDTLVAPRNELELQLTKIWEQVLDVRPIGIRDNFFELGGHSLMAIRLFTEIEKTFGQSILLSTLFQAQTIEDLATILSPKQATPIAFKSIVEIQLGNPDKPPLFCIHAIWGNILFCRSFINYLETDRAVYGLQALGLDGEHQPCTSISEMANNYIKEIQTVQPHGPYLLSGFSLGGLIAFEIAQQLQAQGEEIQLLGLVDTSCPNLPVSDRDPHATSRTSLLAKTASHFKTLLDLSMQETINYIWNRLSWNLTLGNVNLLYKLYLRYIKRSLSELRLIEVYWANYLTQYSYAPKPYLGKITLFKSEDVEITSEEDTRSRWALIASEGVDVVPIVGNHADIMDEPNVRVLSAKFKQYLN